MVKREYVYFSALIRKDPEPEDGGRMPLWNLSTKLRGVTSQKTEAFINTGSTRNWLV